MMTKTITAEEFDRKFDNGEDVSEYMDYSSKVRINQVPQSTLTITLSQRLEALLHKEAEMKGVTSDLLVQQWVAEQLQAAVTAD